MIGSFVRVRCTPSRYTIFYGEHGFLHWPQCSGLHATDLMCEIINKVIESVDL